MGAQVDTRERRNTMPSKARTAMIAAAAAIAVLATVEAANAAPLWATESGATVRYSEVKRPATVEYDRTTIGSSGEAHVSREFERLGTRYWASCVGVGTARRTARGLRWRHFSCVGATNVQVYASYEPRLVCDGWRSCYRTGSGVFREVCVLTRERWAVSVTGPYSLVVRPWGAAGLPRPTFNAAKRQHEKACG
jgi:hypothetical protein